jgi:hypothetical protein
MLGEMLKVKCPYIPEIWALRDLTHPTLLSRPNPRAANRTPAFHSFQVASSKLQIEGGPRAVVSHAVHEVPPQGKACERTKRAARNRVP